MYVLLEECNALWLADLATPGAQADYCAANMGQLMFARSAGASVGPKPTYTDTIYRQTDRGHVELVRRLASLAIMYMRERKKQGKAIIAHIQSRIVNHKEKVLQCHE